MTEPNWRLEKRGDRNSWEPIAEFPHFVYVVKAELQRGYYRITNPAKRGTQTEFDMPLAFAVVTLARNGTFNWDAK